MMKKGLLFTALLMIYGFSYAQKLSVKNLTCDYRANPLGVDRQHPGLSWQLVSSQKNTVQTAYRVLVADDSLQLVKGVGNVWDSKKVNSDASIHIAYGGKKLESAKKYYWRVMVWDNHASHSTWSEINHWQMGLLTLSDWQSAKWIAFDQLPDSEIIVPAWHGNGKKSWGSRPDILPQFRKTFVVGKKIKSATAFISGLGHFEMYINGEKTGDHFLDPGWTNYNKSALYVTFDITRQLKTGENAVGVMLGNGFYYVPGDRYRKLTGAFGYPKMICRLVVEYTDGTVENIVSGEDWKTAPSPVTFSSIYGGEDYDATKEMEEWDTPSFYDSRWKQSVVVSGPALESQTEEPLRIKQVFHPVSKKEIKTGAWVFDFGQNMSGIPQITVEGKRGDTIKLTPAELLNDDGTPNQNATGKPHYYLYILKGGGRETWHPRFTYYGYRYLQVEHIYAGSDVSNGFPRLVSVEGLHTGNDAKRVGSFKTSNELFDKTEKLIDWAIKNNMASVFTDCPHREKLGWLEQTHLMGSSVKFNYDIATLARKTIRDMIQSQTADGLIPEIAPEFVKFDDPFRDSPEWGSAAVILPWYLYQWYGEKRFLEEAYPMMKRYVDYLASKAQNHILMQGLGDWYDLGPDRPGVSQLTPQGLTATAIYYYDLTILSKVADLLDKQSEAKTYSAVAGEVKTAYNQKFFDKTKEEYGSGSQTSNAMSVFMNLADAKDKPAVIDNLVRDIHNRNNSLTSGDIGYRYLLKVLDAAGRSDVIYEMNNRSDVPGYGYQLAKGATALTESWQALPTVSNDHFMLGHILEWFYEGLAGISQQENSVGYKHIVFRPQPVGNISETEATYQSPYGTIKTHWKRSGGHFEIDITVPANSDATLFLPGKNQPVKVGSGNYHFQSRLN